MLSLRPVSLAEANNFVKEHHRHHKPVRGHKFSLGCMDEEHLAGVAIVGRPVSRYLDDGMTLEVNRLCTDGTRNACSFLYGAAARVANVEDSNTEVTGPGDYIRFRLAVQPPRLSSGDTLDHFVIEDVRSKGLELEKLESVTDTLGQTYVEGTDYTRTEETVADGTRMLLTFTQQGLQKLERLGQAAGTLTVTYTAQVTDEAPTAGITNSARIDYKVDYAPDRDNPPPPDDPPPEDDDDEYHSDWDVARSYTFGVHLTKYLGEEGNLAPEGSVTFALYREKDGQKQAVPLSRSGDAYQVVLQGSNELSISADGTFTILGLGEGTYYLRELSTAEGYALPNEDIALTLAGERSAGEYTGRLDAAQCTVDGQQGNASVQDGTLYLSVINPRTFYIPNTGGAGSWMFTAGGLLIIAGGVVYLAVSRKKKG